MLALQESAVYLSGVETSPLIDEDYLSFIRSKPCVVDDENCLGDVIVHHIKGRGMGGGKRNDHLTTPHCSIGHHVGGKFSIHQIGKETFEERHFVDLYEISNIYLSEYHQLSKEESDVDQEF